MKESTYKIYTRQYGGRFFSPLKFNCTILTQTAGKVNINNNAYQTNTVTAENFIYSISKSGILSNNALLNCCFRIPHQYHHNKQSFIYNKIINHYYKVTGYKKSDISIIKDKNGIPSLLVAKVDFLIPVSITHHGDYAAFTID